MAAFETFGGIWKINTFLQPKLDAADHVLSPQIKAMQNTSQMYGPLLTWLRPRDAYTHR